MRHYFFHVSNKKMYRKNLITQVCPSFYILAKKRPNYAYDFLTLHKYTANSLCKSDKRGKRQINQNHVKYLGQSNMRIVSYPNQILEETPWLERKLKGWHPRFESQLHLVLFQQDRNTKACDIIAANSVQIKASAVSVLVENRRVKFKLHF